MKITANIATYPPRKKSLEKMLKSIEGQFSEVRVYDNGKRPDLKDNGKFFFLNELTEPEIYFTLDDDIIYPKNYVEQTLSNLAEYGTIVTYHGRKLLGTGLNYYYDHEQYRCLGKVDDNYRIDVAGTGVMAFDTRYFNPKEIAFNPIQRMSDLIFSLEAARNRKWIGVFEHDYGWFKHIENKETIYGTESRTGCEVQNAIADEIYTLIYGS